MNPLNQPSTSRQQFEPELLNLNMNRSNDLSVFNVNQALQRHIVINPFNGENEDVMDWLSHFENATRALGINAEDTFRILPYYLQGTAKRWYDLTVGPYGSDPKPTTYDELRQLMIQGLCPADYLAHLSQQLHEARQQKGQTTTSFICEVYDLCKKIHGEMPEQLIVNFISERLLPSVRALVILKNPTTLMQLIDAGKLADRSLANGGSHLPANPLFATEPQSSTLDNLNHRFERISDQLNRLMAPPVNCNYCQQRGRTSNHREEDCRRKIRENNYPDYPNRRYNYPPQPIYPVPRFDAYNGQNLNNYTPTPPYQPMNYSSLPQTYQHTQPYQPVQPIQTAQPIQSVPPAQHPNRYRNNNSNEYYQAGRPGVTNSNFANRKGIKPEYKPKERSESPKNWREKDEENKPRRRGRSQSRERNARRDNERRNNEQRNNEKKAMKEKVMREEEDRIVDQEKRIQKLKQSL